MSLLTLRIIRRIAVFLSLGFILVSCTTGGVSTGGADGPKINPNGKVKVALLVPSESANENDNKLAQDLIDAAGLALKKYGSVNIDLSVYSTQGQAGQAQNAARRALAEGNKIIIGPLYAQSARAVSEVTSARGINVMSFSNTTSIAGGNLITLGNSVSNTASRLIGYASTQGMRSIAVVTPENAAGNSAVDAVKTAAERSGASFVGAFQYPFSPEGIQRELPSIKGALKDVGADAVVISADSGTALPIVAQLLTDGTVSQSADGSLSVENSSGYKLLGLSRWDIPTSNLGIRGLRGGWFTIPESKSIGGFNSSFLATYGRSAHPISGLAYDGVSAVAQLMKEGNSGAVQRSQLSRATGFKGSMGAFRILNDNTTQRALSLVETTNGSFKVLSDAPSSFGN